MGAVTSGKDWRLPFVVRPGGLWYALEPVGGSAGGSWGRSPYPAGSIQATLRARRGQ
jgi:hypothetical protein